MPRVKTALEGHSLESGDLIEAQRAQCDGFIRTARELRPLRLSSISLLPLPQSEPYE